VARLLLLDIIYSVYVYDGICFIHLWFDDYFVAFLYFILLVAAATSHRSGFVTSRLIYIGRRPVCLISQGGYGYSLVQDMFKLHISSGIGSFVSRGSWAWLGYHAEVRTQLKLIFDCLIEVCIK